MRMKLCVIGAGPAGLVALRHATYYPYELDCVAFEQMDRIGGTWVYTDATEFDDNGVSIHSSMYKNLKTNLPKEIMGFTDFPIETDSEDSFVKWNIILSYLNDYAKHFDLLKFIKLNHRVKLVKPVGSKWEVTSMDLVEKQDKIDLFDAVIVCNGHNHKPFFPQFKGANTFTGLTLHSHQYRTSDIFVGLRAVVVGEGPSGLDLTGEIAQVAPKVFMSREPNKSLVDNPYPSNVDLKLKILEINGKNIIFEDGSSVEADAILYCTGYHYYYPFLTDDCEIRVVNGRVEGLYKHMISIARPTLGILGIPYHVSPLPMSDVQVRCFLNILTGKAQSPSQKEMVEDVRIELARFREAGHEDKYFHDILRHPGNYYNDIAEVGNTEPLPPVINKIHESVRKNIRVNRKTFRNAKYKIVDPCNFIEST